MGILVYKGFFPPFATEGAPNTIKRATVKNKCFIIVCSVIFRVVIKQRDRLAM